MHTARLATSPGSKQGYGESCHSYVAMALQAGYMSHTLVADVQLIAKLQHYTGDLLAWEGGDVGDLVAGLGCVEGVDVEAPESALGNAAEVAGLEVALGLYT